MNGTDKTMTDLNKRNIIHHMIEDARYIVATIYSFSAGSPTSPFRRVIWYEFAAII